MKPIRQPLSIFHARKTANSRFAQLRWSIVLAGLALILASPSASASVCSTPITVMNTNDSGPGSLRQAIIDICPDGTIDFASALEGQTIGLSSGELVIGKSMTILGLGANRLALSGNNQSRVFYLSSNAVTTVVAISGLSIRSGNGVGADPLNFGTTYGGGIFSHAVMLTLSNCVLSSSSATYGGGLFSNFGTETIRNCTISDNQAEYGGGIFNQFGTRTLLNSTISSNSAISGSGGGIYNQQGTNTSLHCTLSGNSATIGGGGIHIAFGSDTIQNTIVAHGSLGENCLNEGGKFVSLGYNLSDDTSCTNILKQAGDTNDVMAQLGPLQDNGGPTFTHALLPGSPAINAGDPAFDPNAFTPPLSFDQRGPGFPRNVGGTVDIGAFELQSVALMITCQADSMVNTDSNQCYASVTFSNTVTGSPTPGVRCTSGGMDITSPHQFPIGTNAITCTATNSAGTNSCMFTITVNDTEPPSITCASDLVLRADTSQCSRSNVTWAVTATDNCTNVTLTCTPPNGSTLPVGTNTIVCTATDSAGNSNSCAFTAAILDDQPPEIFCPSAVFAMAAPGATSAVVNFTLTGTDNCSVVSTNCTPPSDSEFPLGSTIVFCTVTDAAGLTNGCSFTVTVCSPLITVVNANDSGPGSLRWAIANVCTDGTIDFAMNLTGQMITLTSGHLSIGKNLRIVGLGPTNLAVARSMAGGIPDFRILLISNAVTEISGLTLSNGLVMGSGGATEVFGGGICNLGGLTLSNCVVSGNAVTISVVANPVYEALGGGLYNATNRTAILIDCTFRDNSVIAQGAAAVAYEAKGGGIFNDGGTLQLLSCSVSSNRALAQNGSSAEALGGGLGNDHDGITILTNCTVSGNSAIATNSAGSTVAEGGGIGNNGGSITLAHVTVTSNAVTAATTAAGGGVYSTTAITPASVFDTIIAGNDGSTGPDVNGGFASQGHNLIGITNGALGFVATDLKGSMAAPLNPLLGPLDNNGGPTRTHALMSASPARDAGDNAGSPAFDQRGPGFPRIVGGVVDIGAFELKDTTPPQITCPADITVTNASGQTQTVVTFTVTAMDDSDPNPMVICMPQSGSAFPEGTNVVRCIATDVSGNSNTCSFNITVVGGDDTTPPQITCPADITVTNASGQTQTVVTFTVTAMDDSDPNPMVVCMPQSGSAFPEGTTAVRCIATDVSGNSNTCSFNITVVGGDDTTPPQITCPADITVTNASGQTQTVVTFTVTAMDDVDPNPMVVCTPQSGSAFPEGTTLVSCVATDVSGNSNTCSFNITVVTRTCDSPPLADCVADYRFNESSGTTALDSSGNNLHGMLVNGPTRIDGIVCGALQFDGMDDYVAVPDTNALDFHGRNFTVALWVKTTKAGPQALVEKQHSAFTGMFLFAINRDNLTATRGAFSVWTGTTWVDSNFRSVTNGMWHHLAVTFDGTRFRLYRDGQLDKTSTTTPSYQPTSGPLNFGRFGTADQGWPFGGILDEIIKCDRALSAAELAALGGGQPPATLTIASVNPTNGVAIAVTPNDSNGQGNGSTLFTRTYASNTLVTLTAPATAAGNAFVTWQRDGTNYTTNLSAVVTMDANHALTAVYATPAPPSTRTLTVISANPNSGVSITVSPSDNNGAGNGTTTFMRVYSNNVLVMLSAPAVAAGNPFFKWQLDGADLSTNLSVTITNNANHTLTALYGSGDLVAWWKLDETNGLAAFDSSGSGHHGTLTNGPIFTNGMCAGGLFFDGTNDFVRVPDASLLDFNNKNFTVTLKIKTSKAGRQALIEKQHTDFSGLFLFALNRDNVVPGKISVWNGGQWIDSTGAGLTDGNWHHVAVTFDGTAFRLYRDGGLDKTKNASASYVNTALPLNLGRFITQDSGWAFQGVMDEVRRYNRALSDAEVAAMTNCPTDADPGPLPRLAITLEGEFVRLQGTGQPNRVYQIEASNDLNQWRVIGSATAGGDGQFEFLDEAAEEFTARFYRLVEAP